MRVWQKFLKRVALSAGLIWVCQVGLVAAQSVTKATIRPIATPAYDSQSWNTIEQQIEYATQDAPSVAPGASTTDKLFRPITAVNIDILPGAGKRPTDRAGDLANYNTRDWSNFEPVSLAYLWEAPDIRYQPLYFEDIALERYGQTCNPVRQVAQSATHFGVSFLTLPYHLMIDPSWNCDTNYGYCRPGSDTPFVLQRFIYPY